MTDSNLNLKSKILNLKHTAKLISLAKKRVEKKIFLSPGTYLKYMEYLRSKLFEGATEKHHVIPTHKGGSSDPSNLISIGKSEHILAHLLLYLEKADVNDLKAYIFRKYSKHIDLSSQSKKSRALDKVLKRGFFNSKMQRQNGLKGGKKGGVANTKAQFSARSKVGKTYGRQVGIKNQGDLLKEKLTKFLIWEHKDAPNVQFITSPSSTGWEIAVELNIKCEELAFDRFKIDVDKVKGGGFFL